MALHYITPYYSPTTPTNDQPGLHRSLSAEVADEASRVLHGCGVSVSAEEARRAIDAADGNLINAVHALESNLMQVSIGFGASRAKRGARNAKPVRRRRSTSRKPSPPSSPATNATSSLFELPALKLLETSGATTKVVDINASGYRLELAELPTRVIEIVLLKCTDASMAIAAGSCTKARSALRACITEVVKDHYPKLFEGLSAEQDMWELWTDVQRLVAHYRDESDMNWFESMVGSMTSEIFHKILQSAKPQASQCKQDTPGGESIDGKHELEVCEAYV